MNIMLPIKYHYSSTFEYNREYIDAIEPRWCFYNVIWTSWRPPGEKGVACLFIYFVHTHKSTNYNMCLSCFSQLHAILSTVWAQYRWFQLKTEVVVLVFRNIPVWKCHMFDLVHLLFFRGTVCGECGFSYANWYLGCGFRYSNKLNKARFLVGGRNGKCSTVG